MKQTSIEWLVKILYSPVCKGFIEGRTQIPFHIIDQAKEMHKKEIIEARINGHNAPSSTLKHFDAEQYYEMTYGK